MDGWMGVLIQARWFQGPHMLKCLAKLLTVVADPEEMNAFVRLAEEDKIVEHLVQKVCLFVCSN